MAGGYRQSAASRVIHDLATNIFEAVTTRAIIMKVSAEKALHYYPLLENAL